MSQKEGVDALVKEYLLSRGYTKTVAEMDLEASQVVATENPAEAAPAPAPTLASSAPPRKAIARHMLSNVAEDIYIIGMKDKDTSSYFTGYDSIRSWAVNSIDIVKPQLLSLCFPVFVHCYLGMVRLGFHAEAQEFLNEFKADYAEYQGEELQRLSSLTLQEQYNSDDFVSNDPFISSVLASKFIVRLSSLAFNLLTLFLVQSDLVLIASIINNKISFKKLDDAQAQASSEIEAHDVLLVELPGYTAGSTPSPTDFVTIPLGVPGTVPKIQRLLGTQTTASTLTTANVSLPNSKEDQLYRDLINKIVRPRSVLSSLAKRSRAVATGGSENLPDSVLDNAEVLGAFSIEAAVEMSELSGTNEAPEADHNGSGRNKSKDRAPAGSKLLSRGDPLEPSVIFATVTNAYEGMTCMHITPGVSQMATGHRDSSVRVWRLNPTEDTHFGKLLKNAGPQGEWGMNEVLPKTKRMLQEDAESARSGGGAYSGVRSSSSVQSALSKSSGGLPMLELRGHSRAVYGVSQDCSRGAEDRLVLSCSADETIRLWDTAVSQCVGRYSCVSPSWGVSFSPLGYHFASANQDKTGTVFSTDRVTPLRLLAGHVSDVNCVSWHGNATLLATGSDDKTARLWDVRSSHSVRLLRGCATPLACTAISPLGNLLAAGTDNGKIYVWDLTTSRPLAVLQGHEKAVHSVAFSSDGAALSSGGADCSVRVWDLQEVIKSQVKLNAFGNLPSTAASSAPSSSAGTTKTNGKPGHFDAPQLVLAPQNSYFTKFSPVFHVGYTAQDLLYAGGPFSLASATASREPRSGEGAHSHAASAVTEQDTISALGISHAVQTSH